MARRPNFAFACATAMFLVLAAANGAPARADDSGSAFAEKGKQALAKGDNAGALKSFLSAHKAAPDNLAYVHNAAAVSAALGKTEESVGLYQAAMKLAMAAGNRDDFALYAGEVSKVRDALPGWVAERQAKASAVPPGKDDMLNLWNRYHSASVKAAGANNLPRAVETGNQALTMAVDNLGPNHMASIVSASDLAQVLAMSGKAEEASAAYAKALAAAEQAFGPGHPEVLKIQANLADLAVGTGNLGQAIEIRDAAAKAAAKALGGHHDLTLDAQLALARTLEANGKYAEAAAMMASVCAARQADYGEVHPKTGRCLAEQASVEKSLGEIEPAATQAEQALAIEQIALAPTDPALLALRIEMAAIWLKQAKMAEAQTMLESVVADATAAGDQASAYAAKADLVDVIDERGEHAEAETLARDVLAYYEQALGANHPTTLAALTSLGSVQRKLGHLADAEVSFKTAYERYRKVFEQDHPVSLTSANNLGEILEKEGLYDQAEPFLRESVATSRKLHGDTHPSTLVGLNNLALLYESQGNFDKAETIYNSIIPIFAKKRGANHPDTVAFVNNLAYLYILMESYDKAEPLFRQVVASWTATYGANHQNTLKARNSLARVLHRTGKLAEAEADFQAVLAARRKVLGETHLDVLRTEIDLGNLYRTTKNPDKAIDLLTRTRDTAEKTLGPLHPYTFEAMNALAGALEDKGNLKGALEVRATTFARRTEFLNRMLYVTGDNAREGYVRLHQPEYAEYLNALTRTDPESGGKGILDASLNRKGILFKVASELQQIIRLSRSPELAKLSDELNANRKKLAAMTLSGPTAETRDNYSATVNGLEESIHDLQRGIGQASIRFRKTVSGINLDDLVKALPDDAVLVDFSYYTVDGQQHLVAGTMRKVDGKPVYGMVIYPDAAAIDAAVQKYRTDIQNEDMELDDLLESGQATYNTIWKPLEAQIADKTKVYVVPDGILNILPFTALVEKNNKYLMERLDLHIYTTSRNLLPSNLPPAKGGYLINAGPDYNTDEVTGKDTLEKARHRGGQVQEGLRGMGSGMRGLKFDPLPGAEKEGQLIYQKVEGGGKQTVIVTKGDAQEKVLRNLAEPPEVLHIATHGFFLKADDTLRKRLLTLQRGGDIQLPPPGDNPLLRSGLAFAGINSNAQLLGEIDTDNDGVLTALEVLGLDLTGTRLAILSACETGLGEIHEGEGVYGLRRAFQEAGAGSVVSSLWEVSDAGTQTLMTALYARLLAGKEPHEALRQAQLEMLRNGQWASPYIWSAFFMVDG